MKLIRNKKIRWAVNFYLIKKILCQWRECCTNENKEAKRQKGELKKMHTQQSNT